MCLHIIHTMSNGSAEFNNSLDNSDVPIRDNKHSAVGGMFQSVEQAEEYKLYLENLQLISKLVNDTTTKIKVVTTADGKGQEILVKDLIPKESEFERVRKYTISKLNAMKDEDLRQWMARFGTDNIFTLSGRITAYQLDKKKRDEAYKQFDAWSSAK